MFCVQSVQFVCSMICLFHFFVCALGDFLTILHWREIPRKSHLINSTRTYTRERVETLKTNESNGEGGRRWSASNRVVRYAFNEILDDAKTSRPPTNSTISATTTAAAAATIAIVETARFDLKVRPGIERKNPRDNTFLEVPASSPSRPLLIPFTAHSLSTTLALQFFRPVMNSNEWKNRKVPAATTKFLTQVFFSAVETASTYWLAFCA